MFLLPCEYAVNRAVPRCLCQVQQYTKRQHHKHSASCTNHRLHRQQCCTDHLLRCLCAHLPLPTAVRPPLQPMSEEAASDQQQQPSAGQPTSGSSSSSKAIASAAAAARSAPAQSQQQNPQDWREQARLRALEALQRAQDEKAAVLKQQQEEEEAARKARRAKVRLLAG